VNCRNSLLLLFDSFVKQKKESIYLVKQISTYISLEEEHRMEHLKVKKNTFMNVLHVYVFQLIRNRPQLYKTQTTT